jgi:hypothetical protein
MNGWKNKETWLVNVWLGDMINDIVDECGVDPTPDYIETLVWDALGGELVEGKSGLLTDLLNCARVGIDYHELSEHYKQ